MTFAAVGSGFGTSGSSSLSLTTSTIGDFILAEVLNHNGTAAPTALASSNVTWSTLGSPYTATVASGVIQCFIGTVTAASTATLTVTLGSGTTGTLDWCGQEFSSTAGIPVLDVQGHVDTLSSNTNWASLTPAAAGELYWGYCQNAANAAAGSTSGYVYNANIDGVDNGMAYNVSCGATATFPVWGDVTQSLGMMVLVKAPPAAVAVPAPRWKPQTRRTTPVRGRAGRSLVAAGIIGAVGVTPGHAPRPYPVSHPAPQRARAGPLGRNAGGIRGPVNHAAVAVPLGTSMPRVPHPRPQRVLWHGQAGPGNQAITVVAVGPPAWHAQPRRTPPQRAIARGVTGPPNHGYASPPGVQPQIRHPKAQRALWRGLTAPGPRPGPVPQRFLPPRPVKPQRAIWRGVTGAPQSVSGIAVPAPKLLRQPPRRIQYARAIWRAITGPGNAISTAPQQGTVTVVNTLAGTVTISVTPAATVSITSQAAGTVTITSTTAGTATISNQLAGTVTIVNEL